MCSRTRGPASVPSLVTWPMRKQAMPLRLATRDEERRRLAHLADAARRRAERGGVQRLHRVDDDGRRPRRRDELGDRLGRRLADDEHAVLRHAEAVGPQADLLGRLLARDVEDRQPLPRERAARLERERRLADARIAADEHDGALHQPAAEHAVELAEPGRAPDASRSPRPRRAGAAPRPARPLARRRARAPSARPPRPACSTRRSRGTGRASAWPRGRTAGRRRRSAAPCQPWNVGTVDKRRRGRHHRRVQRGRRRSRAELAGARATRASAGGCARSPGRRTPR